VIQRDGEVLRVEGAVTLGTVPGLLEQAGALLSEGVRRIDLGGTTDVDSSAVALALELQRRAKSAGTDITLENVPEAMRNLARLYGVSGLLGIEAA
jgi:phospholipid transport system transporter-binding protein